MRQIKASAGSGKTYRLTRAFLEHLCATPCQAYFPSCALADNTGWGDILGITFTNSAATEMKDRVVTRLKETALGMQRPDALPLSAQQAAAWVTILLRHYNALNIRTIDSLLYHIVRAAALDIGLSPDFTPIFSDEDMLTVVLDTYLARAEAGNDQVRQLVYDVCASLLEEEQKHFLVGRRLVQRLLQVLPLILLEKQHGHGRSTSSRQELRRRHTQFQQNISTCAQQLLERCAQEKLPLKQRAYDALQRCLHSPADSLHSAYLRKEHLDECLQKAGKGLASDKALATYQTLCTTAEELEVLQKAMRYAAIVDLAWEILPDIEEYQQREAQIPSLLIPLLARQILEQGTVPTALCRLGSRLTHLLIDEFQDTSRDQWNALAPLVQEGLAHGGSLTWVGDMKQAIYSWRGGDAALFDEIAILPDLRAIAPVVDHVTLQDNWRSCPAIVAFNNRIFQQVEDPDTALEILTGLLPKDSPLPLLRKAAAVLSASFKGVAQTIPPQAHHTSDGFVHVSCITASTTDALRDSINSAVRQRVQEAGSRRPWSDIVVLVRSNRQATGIASFLMENGIPVVTENSLLLKEHPLILQLAAFLAFLDTPEDDIAFWTLVTGDIFQPLMGTDAPDLHAWAAQRPPRTPLYQAFQHAFPTLWQRFFAPFHRQGSLMRPYDSVQECCRLQQLSQRFPEAETFFRRFLEILHNAEAQGCTTPGLFLAYWQRKGDEEKLPMPEHMDAVRVMTIHKSKGLQFPVVIVPQTELSITPSAPPQHVTVAGLDCIIPCCKAMGNRYSEELAKTAREALHLLYVAWTRAEEELYLFHTSTPQTAQKAEALNRLFTGAGCQTMPWTLGTPPAPATSLESLPPAAVPPANDALPNATASQDTPWAMPENDTAAPEPVRLMNWLPRLKVFRTPSDNYLATGRRRGMLAHLCLEHLRLDGTPHEAARRAVALGLKAFPLPLPDKAQLEQELIAALRWYAALPEAAFWLEHGIPEQRILDETGKEHRVDLLVCSDSPQPEYTVIEYKTGAPEDDHITQVRRYLRLLDAAEGVRVQAFLIYLDKQCCQRVSLDAVSAFLPTPSARSAEGKRP